MDAKWQRYTVFYIFYFDLSKQMTSIQVKD